MRILVTGASGFVGRALCAELLRQKHAVVAAIRKENTEFGVSIETATVCSIEHNTDWSAILRHIDVVVHLAARVHIMSDHATDPLAEFRKVNVAGTFNLAMQAAKAGVKRFIFISSVKVNGEHTEVGIALTEESPVNPQDAYGMSKLEAEQRLLLINQQTGMELVVIRPPLVYGAGVKANFLQLMSLVERSFPLPLARINNQRSMIYVGNLVDVIITCAKHPKAVNQVYLVSDNELVSTPQLVRKLAQALGNKSWVLPLPIFMMKLFAKLFGKSAAFDRLTQSLVIDASKIRKQLDWQPPYTIEQGLKITADWFKNK